MYDFLWTYLRIAHRTIVPQGTLLFQITNLILVSEGRNQIAQSII